MSPLFIGLIWVFLPLLIAGSFFALAILKIPKHYREKSIGWVYFYSVLIALGISVLLFWNTRGPRLLYKMVFP